MLGSSYKPDKKLPAASFFLLASMLGTIDGLLSVMLCYSKYGATGIEGTRPTPSVVLSTWQLSYYVETCGIWVSVHEIEKKVVECLRCTTG